MINRKEMRQAERRHREKQDDHRKSKEAYLGGRLARIEKMCGRGKEAV